MLKVDIFWLLGLDGRPVRRRSLMSILWMLSDSSVIGAVIFRANWLGAA
jgi:hypothetical protein